MERQKKTKADISPARRFARRADDSTLAESKNLLAFCVSLIRGTEVFRIWEKLIKYVRRFRLVTAAFRLFPWILLLINTNTLLYAVTGAALFLLPFVIIGLVSLVASASIQYRRLNAAMRQYLAEKTVYIFFPTRSGEFATGRFWRGNIIHSAAQKSTAVLVVSPFLLSPRGLTDKGFYFNLRGEYPHIFLVRRHYFFSLRKNVLSRLSGRQFYIY